MTETLNLATESFKPFWRLGIKRAIALLAVLAGSMNLAACTNGGNSKAITKVPTASAPAQPGATGNNQPVPLPSRTVNAEAKVFLDGIANLPDDQELVTIVDRICRLRKEDLSAIGRYSSTPNADEISSLERGYNQVYAINHGEPGPDHGGENWASRAVQRQCPEVSVFKPSG